MEGSGYWRRAEALLEGARGLANSGDYLEALHKCREAVDLAVRGLLKIAGYDSATAPDVAQGVIAGELVRRGWLKASAARQLIAHLDELDLIFGTAADEYTREDVQEALWEAGWVLDLTFAAALPRLLAEEGVSKD